MKKLTDNVCYTKGIGPKKAKLLEKLNIHTLEDVLNTYPRDYEDRTHITPISELVEGEKMTIRAIVGTEPSVKHIRNGMDITKCTVYDDTGTLEITYFNNKYAAALLRRGEEYLFYGRVQEYGNRLTMTSPVHEKCDENTKGKIVPVYPLTAGISQYDFEKLSHDALDCEFPKDNDPIPNAVLEKYNLLPLDKAISQIHRPQTMDDIANARRRIVFEELFLLCCGLNQMKQHRKHEQGVVFKNTNLDDFWNLIGFKPTNAQIRAVSDLIKDVKSGKPMNRLIQGDVGSGKTAVAAALCMLAVKNGYQAAVMAPTEILASQHEQSLAPIFAKLGIQTVILTGSMGAKIKREALEKIENGTGSVVIGTHALIQKGVKFARLGAVVADEQHRFGVNQRAMLREKGDHPHTLVMSATPIPRTLALIMYGDLDVSIIDELPPNRTPVETYAVGEKMRRRVFGFMEKQILTGGQVYVVCPLVEEGELMLKNTENYAKSLAKVFPHRRIGVLHGKMKPSEKENVMELFASGKLDILVSTTVIEVGVNVPNASLMVVEDADRFGLSQLHQLRGRVGRGKRKSYCIFFGADKSLMAKQRLGILTQTNDGFEVARADLAQRGPGDFFGNRQHGLPTLKNVDIISDMQAMEQARYEAEIILNNDENLENYPVLKNRIERMFEVTGGNFN